MKKACACLLLFTVLLQITTAWQLLKMPVLFEHFSEHRQRTPDISMMHFITMHYLGQDEQDNDADRDMQLPFKKISDYQVQYQLCIPAPRIAGTETVIRIIAAGYPLIGDNALPDACKGALFKPPRA